MRQLRCCAWTGTPQNSKNVRSVASLSARFCNLRKRARLSSALTLELNHRRSPVLGGFCLEELARCEIEHSGNYVARKRHDLRVQVAHDGVVVAARVLDRVFRLRQLILQRSELLRSPKL